MGSKAGALLPTHAFLEKIPSQEKRPPGDLPKNLRNARDRNHTSQDETEGRRPLLWSRPASRVSIPARAAKSHLSFRTEKKARPRVQAGSKPGVRALRVDQRPRACLSPSKSPPEPPSPSQKPLSCHWAKTVFSSTSSSDSIHTKLASSSYRLSSYRLDLYNSIV